MFVDFGVLVGSSLPLFCYWIHFESLHYPTFLIQSLINNICFPTLNIWTWLGNGSVPWFPTGSDFGKLSQKRLLFDQECLLSNFDCIDMTRKRKCALISNRKQFWKITCEMRAGHIGIPKEISIWSFQTVNGQHCYF